MQVTFTPTVGDEVVLSSHDLAFYDFKNAYQRQEKIQPLIDADAPNLTDQKNGLNYISFSAEKEFDTLAEAEAFVLTWPSSVSGKGVVTFEKVGGDKLYIHEALVRCTNAENRGVTGIAAYDIKGEVTEDAP